MAKRKTAKGKTGKKTGGPYLAAALFCETIIEDKKDNTLTAVRIMDQINFTLHPSTPKDFPSETQRLSVPVPTLLAFKTGYSHGGEHTVRIIAESPSGKRQKIFEQVLAFSEAPNGGANLNITQVIHVKKGGLFWLHVFLDGKRVARMPLMISLQRGEEVPDQPGAQAHV
jgi:hypothetical protein